MKEWSKDVFAKNLVYYMNKSGKTQKELSEIIGVSPPTFNDYVKAKKFPRIDKIERLANYFGILKSDLIEDKSEVKSNIRALREQRNLSLYEMAQDLHIDISLLEQYEKGVARVPVETLEKIADYFSVKPHELYEVGRITSSKTTLVTTDSKLAELQAKWFKEVGEEVLSDDEVDKLIEYAKFLISQRK